MADWRGDTWHSLCIVIMYCDSSLLFIGTVGKILTGVFCNNSTSIAFATSEGSVNVFKYVTCSVITIDWKCCYGNPCVVLLVLTISSRRLL